MDIPKGKLKAAALKDYVGLWLRLGQGKCV